MKTSFALLLATAAAVLASPTPADTSSAETGPLLVAREKCYHPGECGWTNSGQCEYHCDGYGGFMYMQGCGWGRKRCCCATKT